MRWFLSHAQKERLEGNGESMEGGGGSWRRLRTLEIVVTLLKLPYTTQFQKQGRIWDYIDGWEDGEDTKEGVFWKLCEEEGGGRGGSLENVPSILFMLCHLVQSCLPSPLVWNKNQSQTEQQTLGSSPTKDHLPKNRMPAQRSSRVTEEYTGPQYLLFASQWTAKRPRTLLRDKRSPELRCSWCWEAQDTSPAT